MYILQTACNSCTSCIPYCPMRAITWDSRRCLVDIDQEECVECGNCVRARVCPQGAMIMPKLVWPRLLRARFSNPIITHPETGIPGRGTEEMKTNDVTGKYSRNIFGMAIEMGRPGIGARFHDVETVTRAIAPLGIHFDPGNPVTRLMTDTHTGEIRNDVLGEKVLSAIIGFDLPQTSILPVLEALRKVAPRIRTVFSLSCIYHVEEAGTSSIISLLKSAGYTPSLCGKTNVGLGTLVTDKDSYDPYPP